jgi:hypothetical protein
MSKRNGTSGTNGTAGRRQGSPGPDEQATTGPAAPESGRDKATGRFRKGFSGNPAGSPVVRKMARLRAAILAVVTEEEVQALFKALLNHGRHGSVPAAALLLAYSLGKAPAYDLDALEGDDP